jgi:type II secretory pathway component PulK
MVAVDIRLRDNEVMDTSVAPGTLARELIDSADDSWIRALVDALDREVRRAPLERLISLWDLSNAAAARLFGVSRQAFSKWLVAGPPADRADDVAAVDDMTALLDRYVKRERIPAVVRRPAEVFGERSMVEMLEAGEYEEAARLVGEMFDLRRVQP